MTNPIGVWLRDLMLPFFLKFSANPAVLDWIYTYSVGWDQMGVNGSPREVKAPIME